MNLAAPLADKANALECLNACAAVYNACTLQTDDCHVTIKAFDTYILIAIRGSKSAQDWLNDLNFPKITTIYGQVHTGFWRSYLTIAAMIHATLRGMPSLPIVVTGHSLGGAQAILCANDLRTGSFNVALVITFGSPRVGDEEFRVTYDQFLSDRTIRYVNARDVVPRLAFSDLGYIHVGQEGFLPSVGGLELNPGVWLLLHDDVVGMVNDIRLGHVELLDDHNLTKYAAAIGTIPDGMV